MRNKKRQRDIYNRDSYFRTYCPSGASLELWLWSAASRCRFAKRCNSRFPLWYFSCSTWISCWTKTIASSIIGSFKEFIHSLSATHLSSDARIKNLLCSARPLPLSKYNKNEKYKSITERNSLYFNIHWYIYIIFKLLIYFIKVLNCFKLKWLKVWKVKEYCMSVLYIIDCCRKWRSILRLSLCKCQLYQFFVILEDIRALGPP